MGKSTDARVLERRGFTRLSIDEVVWARIGRDAAELHPAEYDQLRATAEEELRVELVRLKADLETLRRRLAIRNTRNDANSVTVSAELLERYFASTSSSRRDAVGGEQAVVPRRVLTAIR